MLVSDVRRSILPALARWLALVRLWSARQRLVGSPLVTSVVVGIVWSQVEEVQDLGVRLFVVALRKETAASQIMPARLPLHTADGAPGRAFGELVSSGSPRHDAVFACTRRR